MSQLVHSKPMAGAARKATYQDVLDAPENQVAEVVDGELFLSPRPARPHTRAASRLGVLLGAAFMEGIGGPGGWEFLVEPELHVGEDVVVPDVAAWRRENAPSLEHLAYYTETPDWVCEVLSPSNMRLDRAKKLPVYARAGISHAWLVDPSARTIEVFKLVDGLWSLRSVVSDDAKVRAEPFDAFELDLARLWQL